ncbi:hypothetical protein Tco_0235757 [Tanacetum coccineum]
MIVSSVAITNIATLNTTARNKTIEVKVYRKWVTINVPDPTSKKLIEKKLFLVDDDGKPLLKVVFTVNADSDSEVEEVFDEHATFIASTGLKHDNDSGYGTNSL